MGGGWRERSPSRGRLQRPTERTLRKRKKRSGKGHGKELGRDCVASRKTPVKGIKIRLYESNASGNSRREGL